MDSIFVSFEKAIKKHYAIGAFNFFNLETLQAILEAGEKACSPVICAVSESALKYIGIDATVVMFESLCQKKKFPAYLHLDHGKSFEICKKAIDAGFDSVMIDGSNLPIDENVNLTRKVVKYADKNGVFVEGEIGVLSGIEDNVSNNNKNLTNPLEAKYFVQATGVNGIAVSIGTSHGIYKFKGEQHLDLDRLSEIEKELKNFPIVLHGASTIDQKTIKQINARGGKIKRANGVLKEEIATICTKHNVCKVNVGTDISLNMIASLRKTLKASPSEINPRFFLGEARDSIKELIIEKIKLFKGTLWKMFC